MLNWIRNVSLTLFMFGAVLHAQPPQGNSSERTDQRFACSVEPLNTPVSSLWAHLSGQIKLELIIDKKGAVAEVKSVDSTFTAEETDRAIGDVRQWKFLPATKNGKVVQVRMPTVIALTATSVRIEFQFLWPKGQRGCVSYDMPMM